MTDPGFIIGWAANKDETDVAQVQYVNAPWNKTGKRKVARKRSRTIYVVPLAQDAIKGWMADEVFPTEKEARDALELKLQQLADRAHAAWQTRQRKLREFQVANGIELKGTE